MTDAAVELRGITKRFPGVLANHDVNITVRVGRIHAIVGENGAGKSTLMAILYGMQRPDKGTIAVRGRPVSFASPSEAMAMGIGMVHQHFMLADNLTVLENVILGVEPRRRGDPRIDTTAAHARLTELEAAYGLWVDPAALVSELGVGDRQRVEILKVLYRGASVVILDEPTAVLVPHEVTALFESLRGLVGRGFTILFISHKLDEVRAVADDITVMRSGTIVTTVSATEVSSRRLAELMVGGQLPSPETSESTVTTIPQLTVSDLTVKNTAGRVAVDDVSFTIHRGEIFGIAGVEGNGQVELVEALMGIRSATGRVVCGDAEISGWSTRRRRAAGIGYIPEDRQRSGLLLSSPIWENRILGHQTGRPCAVGPWIDRAATRRDAQRIVVDYDVRTPSVDVAASALSGGNQQKFIVGREMSGAPRLLIAAHPTRGVDVGAQAAIWDQLRAARTAGLAVLLISADLEELIGLSDTLAVMFRGRWAAQVDPSTVTPAELGSAMTGVGGRALP
jgi:general nucleoside transport system ATP-binding protein